MLPGFASKQDRSKTILLHAPGAKCSKHPAFTKAFLELVENDSGGLYDSSRPDLQGATTRVGVLWRLDVMVVLSIYQKWKREEKIFDLLNFRARAGPNILHSR